MIKLPKELQQGIGILLGVLTIAVLYFSVVIVDSGHVGVVRKFGAVSMDALPEGLHFKLPIYKVTQLDIRLDKAYSDALSASKDLQTVRTTVELQYSIVGDLAPGLYQKVGQRGAVKSTIIEPAIQESVKSITAKYTAEELVTQREQVKLNIQRAIDNFIDTTLKQKEIQNSIQIANVAITDFKFSPEFDRAIELKVKAEQEALQARNEKIRRVTQAEAAAQEQQLKADAEAYEINVQSKARAEAIAREAKSLKNNPELIQLRMAEKWDGKLPQVNGTNAVPFLNFNPAQK